MLNIRCLEAIWFFPEGNFGNRIFPYLYLFGEFSVGGNLSLDKLISPEIVTNPKMVIDALGLNASVTISVTVFATFSSGMGKPEDYLGLSTFKAITAFGCTGSYSQSSDKTIWTVGLGKTFSIGVGGGSSALGFGYSEGAVYYVDAGAALQELFSSLADSVNTVASNI